MSSDYIFMCSKCRKIGGGFTRQAWGTGNADIIDTFRFIMKHWSFCRGDPIILDISDGTTDDLEYDRDEDLLSFFPHSHEWTPEVNEREYEKYLAYDEKIRKEMEKP
jgi:hypothetical protein